MLQCMLGRFSKHRCTYQSTKSVVNSMKMPVLSFGTNVAGFIVVHWGGWVATLAIMGRGGCLKIIIVGFFQGEQMEEMLNIACVTAHSRNLVTGCKMRRPTVRIIYFYFL